MLWISSCTWEKPIKHAEQSFAVQDIIYFFLETLFLREKENCPPWCDASLEDFWIITKENNAGG